jgi:hypothetical protein
LQQQEEEEEEVVVVVVVVEEEQEEAEGTWGLVGVCLDGGQLKKLGKLLRRFENRLK